MDILFDILEVAIYSVIGIVLMMVGNFLIDLIIPCSFPEEIKRGNKAVGFVSAGTNIGVGMLLKAAISSPTVVTEAVKESLASGIFGSVLYFVIGILFFMVGYLVIRFINKKYNLNDEVGCGNTAAGIMVAGIFIGLATVISGVIA